MVSILQNVPKGLYLMVLCLILTTAPPRIAGSEEEGQEDQVSIHALMANLEYDPPKLTVLEEVMTNVTLSIRVNHTLLWNNSLQTPPWMVYPGRVTVTSDDEFRLRVVNGTFDVSPERFLADDVNETITLHAHNLGYANLIVMWEQTSMEQPHQTEPETARAATTTMTTSTSTTTMTTTTTPRTETKPEIPEVTDEPEPDVPEVTDKLEPDVPEDTMELDVLSPAMTEEPEPEVVEHEPEPFPVNGDPYYAPSSSDNETGDGVHGSNPVEDSGSSGVPTTILELVAAESATSGPPIVGATTATITTKKPQRKKKKQPEGDQDNVNIYRTGAIFGFQRGRQLSEQQPLATATRVYFTDSEHNHYQVTILRYHGTTDMLFVIIVSVFVGINTFMMGCQLNLQDVIAVLKKPIGPAVGFVSQFLFMPLASYGLAHLLLTGSNVQLGLFTLGCSPGGSGSNFWTLLLKGDLNLSMTMTFISTTCAIFMMPLWLYTLGQTILQRGHITIPFTNLILSLVSFTVPVGIGIIIRKYKPRWADFMEKLIRPFTFILLIVLNVLAIWNSMYIFRMMTWKIVVAGLSVAWGGYLFGATMAFLFRQKRPQIIAIAIETAIQNPGVTFMVLRLTLKQPDADMSAVPPVAQILVTTFPLMLIYLIYKIVTKCIDCHRRRSQEQQEQEKQLKDDVDAHDPLLVRRMDSATQTPNGFRDSDTSGSKTDNGFGPVLNAKEREQLLAQRPGRYGLPPFPNMYAESTEQDLARRYGHVSLTNQPSLNDDPRRESEPRYMNFRNGKVYLGTDEESPV